MRVRVRLFAQLRERAGASELDLELPEGARVSDALAAVGDLADGLPLVLAVNREYAPVPPVSGGAGAHVRLADGPLSLDAVVDAVRDPRAGAVVTFSGVTRDVSHLDYEAYREMVEPELRRIVDRAIADHGLCAAAAEHRAGRVELSEASVVVAASAPHRPEAFAGARQIIDEIKARAPIWKREEGEWVAGSVPPPAA
jgi:molybdopterin synthase catalytic subunit